MTTLFMNWLEVSNITDWSWALTNKKQQHCGGIENIVCSLCCGHMMRSTVVHYDGVYFCVNMVHELYSLWVI